MSTRVIIVTPMDAYTFPFDELATGDRILMGLHYTSLFASVVAGTKNRASSKIQRMQSNRLRRTSDQHRPCMARLILMNYHPGGWRGKQGEDG